jgi:hypothetical protein
VASNFPAYLAAVAAFTAAALGVWNVILSSRLGQRRELQRWRRETLLPTLVRFLEAVDQVLDTAEGVADVDFHELPEEYRRKVERDHERASANLGWSSAQVDLIAPAEVRTSADELRRALMVVQLRAMTTLSLIKSGGPLDWRPPKQEDLKAVEELRATFLEAARATLGVPSRE